MKITFGHQLKYPETCHQSNISGHVTKTILLATGLALRYCETQIYATRVSGTWGRYIS
jgi:hypothetical protein